MKRLFRSAGGRTVEVAARVAGPVHRVEVQDAAAREVADVAGRWTSQGDLLVESGGVVRRVAVSLGPGATWLSSGGHTWRFAPVEATRAGKSEHDDAILRAPMTGRVVLVHVQPGDSVISGQPLVVVEAMKMEHALRAPRDCMVAQVWCAVGQLVDTGQDLVELSAT